MEDQKFVKLAKFPQDWQEAHLRDYIVEKYREKGTEVKIEVELRGGIADIVVSLNRRQRIVIECKKYLDRETIYQATAQALAYRSRFEQMGYDVEHYVMGLLKTTAKSNVINSAKTTAWFVFDTLDTKVVFLNEEREWYPVDVEEKSLYRTSNWLEFPVKIKLKISPENLAIALIVAIILMTSFLTTREKPQTKKGEPSSLTQPSFSNEYAKSSTTIQN